MIEVVGIGNPIMDFLVHTNKIPATNGYSRMKEYSWQGGGKVPTALVTLGRLGVKTGIIGIVGADAFGRFSIEDFKRHNVDIQANSRPKRPDIILRMLVRTGNPGQKFYRAHPRIKKTDCRRSG